MVALLAVATLTGCGSEDRGDRRFLDQLAERLDARKETNTDFVLAMRDVTTFSWDRLYIFMPYVTKQDVREVLGFEWTGPGSSDIWDDDRSNLLVFVRDQEVVEYVVYPKERGDFGRVSYDSSRWTATSFTPGNAVFAVRLSDPTDPRSGVFLEPGSKEAALVTGTMAR